MADKWGSVNYRFFQVETIARLLYTIASNDFWNPRIGSVVRLETK